MPQSALGQYLSAVRSTLNTALCLRNFPSEKVERHNKPEVEYKDSKELLMNPITICRSEHEQVLIEPSVNSCRMSIKIKQADELEEMLCDKLTSFLNQRAESFLILRRKAVPGYDLSFLITHKHMEQLYKDKLVDYIIQFMEDVDKVRFSVFFWSVSRILGWLVRSFFLSFFLSFSLFASSVAPSPPSSLSVQLISLLFPFSISSISLIFPTEFQGNFLAEDRDQCQGPRGCDGVSHAILSRLIFFDSSRHRSPTGKKRREMGRRRGVGGGGFGGRDIV